MTDTKQFFQTQSPKLASFFICVTLYFVLVQEHLQGKIWTTILKCAPIICLMLYIMSKDFGLKKNYKYSQLILLGLIFSCGGDALLNLDLFPHGMALFACAQICYIFAFGFKPLKWLIAVPLYLAAAAFVAFIFKNLDQVLSIGLPTYVTLLLTMCWRSLARAVDKKNFLTTFCSIGSVLFVISDAVIAVDMFVITVPNARILIMSTYYFAQFAIALSTANESNKRKKKRKNSDR